MALPLPGSGHLILPPFLYHVNLSPMSVCVPTDLLHSFIHPNFLQYSLQALYVLDRIIPLYATALALATIHFSVLFKSETRHVNALLFTRNHFYSITTKPPNPGVLVLILWWVLAILSLVQEPVC